MKFSEEQLEQYRTLGYVIFDCPFPGSLTEECMARSKGPPGIYRRDPRTAARGTTSSCGRR